MRNLEIGCKRKSGVKRKLQLRLNLQEQSSSDLFCPCGAKKTSESKVLLS